jgi:hypothetical protein
MLDFKVPMLAGLFALTACGSDDAVIFSGDADITSEDVGREDGAVTENPLAGDPASFVDPAADVSFSSPEEIEADFQRKANTSLSDAERLKVERMLDRSGISPGDVAIVGRLVLDQHVYTDAEDLLALPDELGDVVSKGRVTSSFIPTTTGTPGPGAQQPAASTIFARTSGANFQFFRPYVQHTVAYIVPQNDFLLTLMTSVTRSVNDAGSDCLTGGVSGTLRAATMANYLALDGNARARLTRISVIIGDLDTACPGASSLVGGQNVQGCSLAPRRMGILHPDGVFRDSMAAGSRIGLVNTAVTGQDALSRRIATHELLHTLGVSHPNVRLTDGGDADTLPDALQVPGTSTNANVLSVMQNACSPGTNCSVGSPPVCCNNVATSLSTDDDDVIDTLYSAQPGGNCNYVDNFQTVVAN